MYALTYCTQRAKTLWSFGHSECNWVKAEIWKIITKLSLLLLRSKAKDIMWSMNMFDDFYEIISINTQ